MGKPTSKFGRAEPLSIALSYDEGSMDAPMVSALGRAELARELRNIARRYGVPVRSNRDLAKRLSELGLCEEIPEELYLEVAKLLGRDGTHRG